MFYLLDASSIQRGINCGTKVVRKHTERVDRTIEGIKRVFSFTETRTAGTLKLIARFFICFPLFVFILLIYTKIKNCQPILFRYSYVSSYVLNIFVPCLLTTLTEEPKHWTNPKPGYRPFPRNLAFHLVLLGPGSW